MGAFLLFGLSSDDTPVVSEVMQAASPSTESSGAQVDSNPMLNERQERYAEAQDAIKAGQQKLAEAAVEQAESSILQNQIDELNETNKRNEEMMQQMMKMMQDGFGQGAFGKGAFGGVEVEEDDDDE